MKTALFVVVALSSVGCSTSDSANNSGEGGGVEPAGNSGSGGTSAGTGGQGGAGHGGVGGAAAGGVSSGGKSGAAGEGGASAGSGGSTAGAGGSSAGPGGSGPGGHGMGGSPAGAGGMPAAGGAGGASTGGASAGGAETGGSGGIAGSGGKAPTLFFDFVSADKSSFYAQKPYGNVTFGHADSGAHDNQAVALLWNANTTAVGPGGKATEIGTNDPLGYGEYRFRTKLATCKSDEELVNGHFTYQNDGGDHDKNGMVDNAEIDIEILCSQPGFFNLTSWTDYTDDTHMRKKSRIIDLDTGTILVGKDDDYGVDQTDPLTNTVDPNLMHPGWYDSSKYYEMGFHWTKDNLRFFLVLDGQELTLWSYTDATRIPRPPAPMLFNLWHPADHWNKDGTAAPATADATLSIDWFSFTAD